MNIQEKVSVLMHYRDNLDLVSIKYLDSIDLVSIYYRYLTKLAVVTCLASGRQHLLRTVVAMESSSSLPALVRERVLQMLRDAAETAQPRSEHTALVLDEATTRVMSRGITVSEAS